MNNASFHIPKNQLLSEMNRCLEQKRAWQVELDEKYGKDRIPIRSRMSNLGWPELFNYNMNRLFDDPDFSMEQILRQRIFWADNVPDDPTPSEHNGMTADVGMYWDATLFGQKICHTPLGVPNFLPHPFQGRFDLELLGHFDFYNTGDMPKLLANYHRMKEISATQYEGKIEIGFPSFARGPLDLYVQLRGYENFLDDLLERPEELHKGLSFFTDERRRFALERMNFLGEDKLPETTFVGDDWVNVPFISPAIFQEFVAPAYARIQANEAPVSHFHTCGNLSQLASELLKIFPEITRLDISPWTDLLAMDAELNPKIQFVVKCKNTDSLCDLETVQRPFLENIAKVGAHRSVILLAESIQKIYSTYDETLCRLNRFLSLARDIIYEAK